LAYGKVDAPWAASGEGNSVTSLAARLARAVWSDADQAAIEIPAIERGHGCAGLMPFHIDGSKAFAVAGKDISYQLDGAYLSVFREKRCQGLFGG